MSISMTARSDIRAVSVAEAKRQIRITHSEEDDDIARLIDVATDLVEGHCWRCVIRSTYKLRLKRFPRGREPLVLPNPQCDSLTSVTYLDAASNEQSLSGVLLNKRGEPATIEPAYDTSWPVTRGIPESVCVTFVAGFDDAAQIPPAIKQAILVLVGKLYVSREDSVEIGGQTLAARLLARWRCNDHRIADVLNAE